MSNIVLLKTEFDSVLKEETDSAREKSQYDDSPGSVSSGTYTIGAAGDYATITAAEADIAASLTGDLRFEHLNEATAYTSVFFDSTTGSYTLTITAQAGAEPSKSVYGDGARLVANGYDLLTLRGSNSVTISNLAFTVQGTSSRAVYVSGCDDAVIDGLLIKGGSGGSGLIRYDGNVGGTGTGVIRNCIIYDHADVGIYCTYFVTGHNLNIYNNTIIDCSKGIEILDTSIDSTINIKNNLCQENTTDYDLGDYTASSKNISEDSSSPDSSYQSKDVNTNSVFKDYAGEDYRLTLSGDTTNLAIVDDGDDLSSSFKRDVVNRIRDTWYIGASEPQQQNAYYSASPFGTGDLKNGSPTITITDGAATLSVAQTGNIGQGDRITFDTDKVAYISKVNSGTSMDVVNARGVPYLDDVTTETVNSIAHEYASLSAAEAGCTDSSHNNSASLITTDVVMNLVCYYDHDDDTEDTTTCNVEGITAGVDNYLYIHTPQGGTQSINNQRHAGTIDSSPSDYYRMNITSGYCIRPFIHYIKTEGIYMGSDSGSPYRRYGGTGEHWFAYNVVYKGSGAWSGSVNVQSNYADTCITYVYNNVIKSTVGSSWAVNMANATEECVVYNNTLIGDYRAIHFYSGTGVAKNNICVKGSSTTVCSGTFIAGTDYNATDHTSIGYTVTGSGNTHDVTSADFDFTNSGSGDYSIGTDSDAKDAGVDLSSDGEVAFDDDVIGEDRGATWDIGAFEYVAAPPADGVNAVYFGMNF